MWRLVIVMSATALASPMQSGDVLAPTGILRGAFIADNPVQGKVDPQTGAITGIAADLTRELARRAGVASTVLPLPNPAAVIESVRTHQADIGFLAFEAARAEQVDFSKPYVLSTSTYLVRADSGLMTSGEVDRAGVRIGTVKGQSQQIFVSANVRNARVEVLLTAPSADAVAGLLLRGELDAFAGNRQRMEDAARTSSKLRVLDDHFMVTAQAIVVDKGQALRLETVNGFLADVRASGFLKTAVDRAAVGGVQVAPLH